jgi:phosphonate ABC transporter permease subunit PhnE
MTNSPVRSQNALRRVVVVLGFTLAFVIFAYGWNVTQIDFDIPQEPIRQQNVGNALRELLSPNVFTQDYEILNTTTSFVINCPADFAAPADPKSSTAYIIVEPACAKANEIVIVRGFNFPENALARMNWMGTDGERRIRQVNGEDNFITEGDGTFTVEVEVPRIRGTIGETHTIETQVRSPIGVPRLSDSTVLVLEKMSETIFLALIATAISILPSAILSFFAAHNLMRPIRTQLGNLLVQVILLPVGALLGVLLLAPLGKAILDAGNSAIGKILAIVLFAGGSYAISQFATRNTVEKRDAQPPLIQWRALFNTLLVALVAIIAFGVIGGIGVYGGSVLQGNILGYVGGFIGSIGQLIGLMMPLLAGLIGAFALSSMGTTLTREPLKRVDTTTSHVLGLGLGAIAGAILLGGVAWLGMTAAWLGLMVPFAAASMASPILPALYRRFGGVGFPPSRRDATLLNLLSWVGWLAGFVFTFWQLNVGQALIEGVLPPHVIVWSLAGIPLYGYIAQALAIGAVLGAIGGGVAGTKRNFPIGSVLYNVTRTLLNSMRSIEPLIMGLVFVIWVGIGPFAGVLALTLHSIASLGKLYSEQIESIDTGPIEALHSTGANHLQTIMFAVVPQIVPPYIAFTMYRWDINVRMSTIIGFVGGGGIGFLLQQQINLLRYREAGVAVLAIAIVVSILDYASAAIREQYT